MLPKVILGGCLIIGAAIVLAAWILRPLPPAVLSFAAVQNPQMERRESLIKSFTEQVMAKTPSLGLPDGDINKVEVEVIALSSDKTTLTIIPNIEWSKNHWTSHYSCELKDDGFGGYVGKYSPVSNNTKEIWLTLR